MNSSAQHAVLCLQSISDESCDSEMCPFVEGGLVLCTMDGLYLGQYAELKCSLRAQSGGMIALHCSTEHFLSENTVLLSSLTIRYEAKVPLGPCSKAASHSFEQSIEVVIQAASD